MTLAKGPSSVRQNVRELMNSVDSESRRKAILTIAKRNNISFQEAQYKQALRIAQAQAKKK